MRETASQELAKKSKVDAGMDLVFLEDLRELACADRERVDQLAAQMKGGSARQSGKGKKMGDLILCDDYRKGNGNGITSTITSTVLGVVLTVAAWLWYTRDQPSVSLPTPPSSATTQDNDTTRRVDVEVWRPE